MKRAIDLKEDFNDEFKWTDVLTELMISKLPECSRLTRSIFASVFTHICPFVTKVSIEILREAIQSSNFLKHSDNEDEEEENENPDDESEIKENESENDTDDSSDSSSEDEVDTNNNIDEQFRNDIKNALGPAAGDEEDEVNVIYIHKHLPTTHESVINQEFQVTTFFNVLRNPSTGVTVKCFNWMKHWLRFFVTI